MSYKVEGKRLTGHPGAQCRVRVQEDGTIDFISYTTRVITAIPYSVASKEGKLTKDMFQKAEEHLDADCYLLECTGTYSKTTRIQMGWFLEEYFPTITVDDMRTACSDDQYYIAHKAR